MLCTLDKCCRKETHERVYQTANRAPVCSCAYVWENASHWHAGRMEIEPCTSIAAVERLDMWAESEIRLCQVVYGLMFSTWIFIIVIVRGVLFFFLPPLPPSSLPPSFFRWKTRYVHEVTRLATTRCKFDWMEENLATTAWIGKNNWIVVGKYFYSLCGVDIFNTNE